MKSLEAEALKILLTMDFASENLVTRNLALSLARHLKAELIGLIVEDEDLLESTRYPFSSEIVFGSAQERKVDYYNMERSLRAWSAQAESLLLTQAQQANIKCSFRKLRGRPTQTLRAETETANVLVFSGLRVSQFQSRQRSHTAYVLVDENTDLKNSVAVIVQLKNEGINNILFIDCGNKASKEKIAETVPQLLQSGINSQVKTLPENTTQQLAQLLRELPAAVVVLPAMHQFFQRTQTFRELQNHLSCPVLVVQ